tara:strand:+ start:56563 stop:56835 length:273 start_codon:yes stop_codon:yes gene_type:complete
MLNIIKDILKFSDIVYKNMRLNSDDYILVSSSNQCVMIGSNEITVTDNNFDCIIDDKYTRVELISESLAFFSDDKHVWTIWFSDLEGEVK